MLWPYVRPSASDAQSAAAHQGRTWPAWERKLPARRGPHAVVRRGQA